MENNMNPNLAAFFERIRKIIETAKAAQEAKESKEGGE